MIDNNLIMWGEYRGTFHEICSADMPLTCGIKLLPITQLGGIFERASLLIRKKVVGRSLGSYRQSFSDCDTVYNDHNGLLQY